jgi:hypothetical protein
MGGMMDETIKKHSISIENFVESTIKNSVDQKVDLNSFIALHMKIGKLFDYLELELKLFKSDKSEGE